ncbi:MAG TPA: GerMN domain-containing protein [Abditibacterium sp.]
MKFRSFFILMTPVVGVLFLASCTPSEDKITAVTPAPLRVIDTILVPGDDDKLHPKKVSFKSFDTQLKSGGSPIPALDEIIQSAPAWFPKGARVKDATEKDGVYTLELSKEWGDAAHWQKGESITQLAIYALVNTLAKDGKKVVLTLEGKPLSTLGEFDVSDAIEADLSLNAPAAPPKGGKPKDIKPKETKPAAAKPVATQQ